MLAARLHFAMRAIREWNARIKQMIKYAMRPNYEAKERERDAKKNKRIMKVGRAREELEKNSRGTREELKGKSGEQMELNEMKF